MSTIPRLLSHYDPTKSPGPILTLGQGSTCLSEGRILFFYYNQSDQVQEGIKGHKKNKIWSRQALGTFSPSSLGSCHFWVSY